MKDLIPKNLIYEQNTVFGDDSKFGKNSNRFEKMMKLVKSIDPAPVTILDLGTGTGFFANEMKQVFPHASVYGVDISKKALHIARKKYKNITFTYANAERHLPFRDNFFDLVISGENIEHLVDTDIYVQEIYRVTKKSKYVLITTPNLASWLNRILLLFGKQPYKTEVSLRVTLPIFSVFTFTFPQHRSAPAVGHLRVFTLDMLIKFLAIYGLSLTRAEGRTMLTKPILRQVDSLFSSVPSLASGLVVLVTKSESSFD